MKKLTELCINYILSNYAFFKNNLKVLPTELIDTIEEEKLVKENYFFNGKWYRKEVEELITKTDWGNYNQ